MCSSQNRFFKEQLFRKKGEHMKLFEQTGLEIDFKEKVVKLGNRGKFPR